MSSSEYANCEYVCAYLFSSLHTCDFCVLCLNCTFLSPSSLHDMNLWKHTQQQLDIRISTRILIQYVELRTKEDNTIYL